MFLAGLLRSVPPASRYRIDLQYVERIDAVRAVLGLDTQPGAAGHLAFLLTAEFLFGFGEDILDVPCLAVGILVDLLPRPLDHSIAVLPTEDISGGHELVATGVTDEVDNLDEWLGAGGNGGLAFFWRFQPIDGV